MAIGDKQAAVRGCVNKILIDHEAQQPIDTTKTLADNNYQKNNMFSFHRQVAKCLAKSSFTYTYDETDAYMAATLAMTLLVLYSTISVKTTGPKAAAGLTAGFAVAKANKAKGTKAKAKKAAPKKAVKKKTAKKAIKKSKKRA